ncbi:MAG: anaerobic glycerol-3-phosphate dehydrogenase subunit C [Chloroflexota bacterium]
MSEQKIIFSIPELSLDQCLKCNICVTACPVAAVTDLFPGPKYAGPQSGRFRMAGQPTPDASVDYCSGCRACNLACPEGVKIAEMNARARHTLVEQGKVPLRLRLRNNLIARTELLGNLGQPIAPLSNALLGNPVIRSITEAALGIAKDAPLPPFARERFTTWFRKRTPQIFTAEHAESAEKTKRISADSAVSAVKQVVFFYGCSTEYYEPRVGRAAVHVLEANGFEVIVPPQNCCGLPLLSNGEFAAARKFHQRNVRNLVEYARQGIPIVGTSTSCTLTLKEEAPELLDMHDEDTRLVAENTYDFSEFLIGMLGIRDQGLGIRNQGLGARDQGSGTRETRKSGNRVLPTGSPLAPSPLAPSPLAPAPLTPIPLTLAYHQPCQYRGHRIGNPAVEVLALIPELQIIEGHKTCCGIAGTYGYKKEKYEIAMAVGQPLFDFIQQVGGPLVVCDSETCRWQITHGTGIPAIHPVELLAVAYGFEPEGALAEVLGATADRRRMTDDG